MRKIFLLFLLAGLLFAQSTSRKVVAFAALSASGTSTGANLGIAAHWHTVQVVVTGSPATCSVQLEGTIDDALSSSATWANLSGTQTCTSTVTFHVVDKLALGVRINLTALTGGSSPTVTVRYVGVQ